MQLARLESCRVVGIAGAATEADYFCKTIGIDAVLDYKSGDDLRAALLIARRNGIFRQRRGDIIQAARSSINHHPRFIIVCGQTSPYNAASASGEAIERLGQLIKQHSLRYRENTVDGLDNAPQAFINLFEERSFGTQRVRVAR